MNGAAIQAAHTAHIDNAAIEDVNGTPIRNISRKDSGVDESNGTTVPARISAYEDVNTAIPTTVKTESPAAEVALSPVIHDFDMLIIGAGISGINMAYRFQESFPNGNYIVLEQRESIGGTWDLMRYPGIRSDSDLYTFGFAWRPWPEKIPIAEGDKILNYMKESAALYGIDKRILFRHKVRESKWSSKEQAWTLTVDVTNATTGEKSVKYCRGKFMVLGTGYYNYDKPLEAKIPGIENFKGTVAHPQFWPKKLDYANKKVAVIGSGATTITLIPALAEKAERVTMVQRSPSYIISMPNRQTTTRWYQRFIPTYIQQRMIRLLFLFSGYFLRRMMKNSDKMRKWLVQNTKDQLPPSIPYEPHFKPTYAPGTQRICLCPDGDFFEALRKGKAGVATGIIKTVTENSIVMESGETIEADIIITATGLHLAYGGNSTFTVDGEPITWSSKFFWRGIMVQDMPNLALVQGYSTASWTLGADATAHMVCRLLKHFASNKQTSAVPRIPKGREGKVVQSGAPGIMGLTSTYIVMAKERLPKHSDKAPWAARGDYLKDLWFAKLGDLRPGLQFTTAVRE